MKSALVKTCPGSRIEFRHDSSNCVRCSRTKSFYNEFQPALQKLKNVTNDAKVCGIITFLDAYFKCEVISEDEKIDILLGQVSKLDYSHLLDSILGVKLRKASKKLAFCSSNVSALNYKYGAKSKQSDKKIEYEDVFEKPHCSGKPHCTGKKSKTVKPKSKRKDPGTIPTKGTLKRKRWYLDKLSKGNDHHADDIFEDTPFYRLQDLDEISSSSSDYSNVGTPTWCFALSPRGHSPTPEYDDFYNVTELHITRKAAEEYQHRRKKRKQQCLKTKKLESNPPPAKVTAKDLDQPAEDLSRPSCSYEIVIPPCKEEKDYDSDEVSDDYFSSQSD